MLTTWQIRGSTEMTLGVTLLHLHLSLRVSPQQQCQRKGEQDIWKTRNMLTHFKRKAGPLGPGTILESPPASSIPSKTPNDTDRHQSTRRALLPEPPGRNDSTTNARGCRDGYATRLESVRRSLGGEVRIHEPPTRCWTGHASL